ncbi:UEV-domain-containing protein [Ramaria rubella]|nr:UEV-domain-containing protein [Ramaria rubella]
MSGELSLTQRWLQQNILPYSQRDLVYNHVDAVLAAFPTLRPKTDVYTFDDGRSQLLLCVHGLLPIQYRRASYNIPISVWLTHQYHIQPPLVYVVPTSDMLVKAGKFIDVSGRCDPPYIQGWQRKNEGCSLKALMEVLTDQFSREPPVYAKPRAPLSPRVHDTSPSRPRTPDYSGKPPPPPPRPTSSTSPSRRPTPPPRPVAVVSDTLTPPTHSPPPTVPLYADIPRHNVYHTPRPGSNQDPPIYSTPTNPAPSSPPSRSHLRPSSATYYSSPLSQEPSHHHQHLEDVPSQRWSLPPGNSPAHFAKSPLPPIVPQYIRPNRDPAINTQPRLPQPPIHSGAPAPPPTRNLLDEDIEDNAASLASVLSDAPPRPPNPEVLRLHAQLHDKFDSEFAALDQVLATDMQRLRTAQADLLAGEPAIRDEMARLEAVRDVCRVVAGRLRSTVQSAEVNLHELRRKGDPEVDELICSTTIVYNQLVDIVAEDSAIEDTIYHLHRALNSGRIDLDKFLRTTRALAEEQFMKRALAEKIVSSIPMGAWN